MTPPPRGGVLLMILASAMFAAMATFVGLAHRADPGLSTLVSSAARAGVNLVVIVLLGLGDPRRLFGDFRPSLWARGFFGGGSLLAYFVSLGHLGIGEAAFLNQTSSVWVAMLAPVVLHERTPPLAWLAVAGSLVGLGFLGYPREGGGDLEGRIAGLASGLFAAGAYLSIRRASVSNAPITIVFYFTLVSTVLSVALVLLTGVAWPRDREVWLLLAGSGIAATFGQLLLTRAYRDGKVGPVAAAGAAGPLFTTLLGWSFLGQLPDSFAWAGMVLLLVTGIALPFAAERRG